MKVFAALALPLLLVSAIPSPAPADHFERAAAPVSLPNPRAHLLATRSEECNAPARCEKINDACVNFWYLVGSLIFGRDFEALDLAFCYPAYCDCLKAYDPDSYEPCGCQEFEDGTSSCYEKTVMRPSKIMLTKPGFCTTTT